MLLASFLYMGDRLARPRGRPDSAGDAGSTTARLAELEHLVRLGDVLPVTMAPEAMLRALQEHLRPLIGRREIRMNLDGAGGRSTTGGQHVPAGAVEPVPGNSAWATFQLVAGDRPVGSLDVARGLGDRAQPLSGWQQRMLETASPVVGRAIRNAQLYRQARHLSAIDALTGCMASGNGMELVRMELRRAQRYARPAALIFIDLDHFKQVNDRYGHLFGNAVLRAVGAALKAALRASDVRCRYGGDEFLVLLPETPPDGALRVAELLRRRLAATTVKRPERSVAVTASIGVAAALPGELDAGGLLARADAAMYRAKRAGRNAVRVWEDESTRSRPVAAVRGGHVDSSLAWRIA